MPAAFSQGAWAARRRVVVTLTRGTAILIHLPPDLPLGDPSPRLTPPQQRLGRYLAFIGKMDTAPNRMAVDWFIRHVLPALPEPIGLKVIGDCSPQKARAMKRARRLTMGSSARALRRWREAVIAVGSVTADSSGSAR